MNSVSSAGRSHRPRSARCMRAIAHHLRRAQRTDPKLHDPSHLTPHEPMTTKLTLAALASILCCQLCPAQEQAPADDWKTASTNQPGKEYPKVNSEGRVKFRI